MDLVKHLTIFMQNIKIEGLEYLKVNIFTINYPGETILRIGIILII